MRWSSSPFHKRGPETDIKYSETLSRTNGRLYQVAVIYKDCDLQRLRRLYLLDLVYLEKRFDIGSSNLLMKKLKINEAICNLFSSFFLKYI